MPLWRSKLILVIMATLCLTVYLWIGEKQYQAMYNLFEHSQHYDRRRSSPGNWAYRIPAMIKDVESALWFTLPAGGSHLECAADNFLTDTNKTETKSQTVLSKAADVGGMHDQGARRHANSLFHDFLANSLTSCSTSSTAKNAGSGKSLCLVILLKNEVDSVPVQTLMSAIEFTPPEILKEIVFVFSRNDISAAWLQDFYKLVAIYKNAFIMCNIRAASRASAIIAGIRHSKSQYVAVVEDSVVLAHNWMEPLLNTLERKQCSIAVPQTYPLTRTMMHNKGQPISFTSTSFATSWRLSWGLEYRQHYFSVRSGDNIGVMLSVIQGDIFMFTREFAHNMLLQMLTETFIELSFLAWMCGDGIQMVRCSRVYKSNYGHTVPPAYSQIERDALADVYMANYTALYLASRNESELFARNSTSDNGHAHNESCKNFDWYARDIAGLPLLDLAPKLSEVDRLGQLMNDDGHTCFTLDKNNVMTEHGSCTADCSVLHTRRDGILRMGTRCLATNFQSLTVMAQCNASETMAYRLNAARLITNGQKCLAAQGKSGEKRLPVPVNCPESDREISATFLWSLF